MFEWLKSHLFNNGWHKLQDKLPLRNEFVAIYDTRYKDAYYIGIVLTFGDGNCELLLKPNRENQAFICIETYNFGRYYWKRINKPIK